MEATGTPGSQHVRGRGDERETYNAKITELTRRKFVRPLKEEQTAADDQEKSSARIRDDHCSKNHCRTRQRKKGFEHEHPRGRNAQDRSSDGDQEWRLPVQPPQKSDRGVMTP